MVVSPTRGECLKGASEVSEQVAEINQGRTVPLYVMWVPRRGGREKDVPAATRVIADTSAHEFWDGNDLLGMQYKQVLGWSGNAWDVYLVYGPKAQWSGNLPPIPDFFMPDVRKRPPPGRCIIRNKGETTAVVSQVKRGLLYAMKSLHHELEHSQVVLPAERVDAVLPRAADRSDYGRRKRWTVTREAKKCGDATN